MHNRSSIKTAEWTCNLMPLWQQWQAKQDQYKNCWGRRCELISSWQPSPVWDCLPRAFNLIKFYFRDVYHAEINTTLTWPALLNSNCANVGHISWSLTSVVGKPANKCDKLNEGWHIWLWLVLDIIYYTTGQHSSFHIVWNERHQRIGGLRPLYYCEAFSSHMWRRVSCWKDRDKAEVLYRSLQTLEAKAGGHTVGAS